MSESPVEEVTAFEAWVWNCPHCGEVNGLDHRPSAKIIVGCTGCQIPVSIRELL